MNRMMSFVLLAGSALLAACAGPAPMPGGEPEYMLVGIDNKVTWDDAGKQQLLPPDKDVVSIRRHRPGEPEDRRQPAAAISVLSIEGKQ